MPPMSQINDIKNIRENFTVYFSMRIFLLVKPHTSVLYDQLCKVSYPHEKGKRHKGL